MAPVLPALPRALGAMLLSTPRLLTLCLPRPLWPPPTPVQVHLFCAVYFMLYMAAFTGITIWWVLKLSPPPRSHSPAAACSSHCSSPAPTACPPSLPVVAVSSPSLEVRPTFRPTYACVQLVVLFCTAPAPPQVHGRRLLHLPDVHLRGAAGRHPLPRLHAHHRLPARRHDGLCRGWSPVLVHAAHLLEHPAGGRFKGKGGDARLPGCRGMAVLRLAPCHALCLVAGSAHAVVFVCPGLTRYSLLTPSPPPR